MNPLSKMNQIMEMFEREFEQLLESSPAEFAVDCCNSVRRHFFIRFAAQRLNDVPPDVAFRLAVTEPAFMLLSNCMRDMRRGDR